MSIASIAPITPTRAGGTRSMGAFWRLGLIDLYHGIRQWRLCYLLATGDMRRRFARSKLGQLWIMLSSAILVVALGSVWSFLWHQPIHAMLPYVAVSMMTWQLISTVVGDATTAMTSNSNYFLNQYTSSSTIIYSVIYRNAATYLLNMVFPLLICMYFGVRFTTHSLQCLLGLALLLIALVWICYLIATLSARYRDVVQVVNSFMQIIFFVTPVLWKPEILSPEARWIVDINPFAAMLAIVRDPLLGVAVPHRLWAEAALLAFGGLAITLPFFGRYGRRIVYWM